MFQRTGKYVASVLAVVLVSAASAQAAQWKPPKQLSWYWQLTGTVNNSYGAAAYDIDGFDNTATEVAKLHAGGKHVICYIDVGTWENWRPDAGQFPAGLFGNAVQGWAGERWLDVRPSGPYYSTLQRLMTARFQMCRQKGFDAVEPDNMDSFDGNNPGFPTTAAQQAAYDEWVATTVHSLGMAVLQKNDPNQVTVLQPYFDGALDEQCNEYSECSAFTPYLAAGKPVLNAEYNVTTSQFCAADNKAGIMGALFSVNLDGSRYTPCWIGNPGFTPPPPPPPPSPPPVVTPQPPGPLAGPPATPAPGTVQIGSGRLIVSHGWVRIRLRCLGRSRCLGTLTVLWRDRHGRARVLGRHRFDFAAGRSGIVAVQLIRGLPKRRVMRALIEVARRGSPTVWGRAAVVFR